MPKTARTFFDRVDAVAEKAGKITCYLVFIIMLITTADVVARYVFNHPLVWGWLLNRQLFGVFILFAGVYTLYKGEHIRIEILYDHFPRGLKTVGRWVSLLAFISFMGVLVWQGAWMGWNSLMMNEKAAGAFRIPWYPFKLMIPAVAFLFLLEGIAAFRRDGD
ncbi:MAG: TRAP transporter small permease [Deltaproteobacteria bacterium]|jgi:TRAP-type mannitol/chloroaromatic compound transport system permease small subunit|nr:TRAP transporter small permease [Deltaproteobacteria bacterium]MBW2467989.1 TRAP transporter small permease [Deltaproteobacteria bacterium]